MCGGGGYVCREKSSLLFPSKKPLLFRDKGSEIQRMQGSVVVVVCFFFGGGGGVCVRWLLHEKDLTK